MTKSHLPSSFTSGTGTNPDRPSGTGLALGALGIVVAAVVIFGVIVPFVFSLLALAVPILLVVAGVGLVSGDEHNDSSGFRKVAGWTSIVVGGTWLLGRLGGAIFSGLWSLAPLLLVGVVVFYAWRALTKRG